MNREIDYPSYQTKFEGTEAPLSEGARWSNDGLSWTHVHKGGGIAFGTQSGTATGESKYADSYAALSGFPSDQEAWGEVFIANPNPSCYQEVEILLRWSHAPNCTTGYECFARCLRDSSSYLQIVRWNGPLADYTYLADLHGEEYGLQNGDIMHASVTGSTITVSVNGVIKAQAVDDHFSTGNPGIGFFLYCPEDQGVGTNRDFGFKCFSARGIVRTGFDQG
jgi:hypothetical protein